MLCILATVLLLSIAVPVAATPSITSISPDYGYNSGTVKVVIYGSDFNVTTSSGTVRLEKDGESDIKGTVKSVDESAGTISATFPISDKEVGDWDVVVRDKNGDESMLSGGFTIYEAITLTSVSPESAQTNNDSAKVTVVGTGLSDIENMYLYNEEYDNITADITSQTSTKIIGTFDLDNAELDNYEICVEDSVGTIKCDLDFEILTDEVGSIEVESSPSGAKVYLDSKYVGTTPYTIDDVELGSHKILISSTGYVDYSKLVTVKADSTVSVSADLNAITTITTRVTTVATTKTIPKATTVKVPTSWPETGTATTQASPMEGMVVLGAIALGFVVLHRK